MIRNWTASAAGALRTTPAPVTRTLIVLCCLVFLIGPASELHPGHGSGDELLAAQRDYFRRWGVIPADLFDGSPAAALTPATALFVHGSWVHLLGNMLFLHVFGPMTEARLGRVRFTLCYAGCGYLALLGYAAANTGSERSLVGASGAISALLGAFLFLFPAGGSPVSCRSPSSCRYGCRVGGAAVLGGAAVGGGRALCGGRAGGGVPGAPGRVRAGLRLRMGVARRGDYSEVRPCSGPRGENQP